MREQGKGSQEDSEIRYTRIKAMDERNDSKLREGLDGIETETARGGMRGRRGVMAGIVSCRVERGACRYEVLRNSDDSAAASTVPKRDLYLEDSCYVCLIGIP